MGQQQLARSTSTVSWNDTVNNNAVWTTAWTLTEHAIVDSDDLNLVYSGASSPISLKIEEIIFTGTGTVPTSDSQRDGIEIMISTNSSFAEADIVHFGTGKYSKAKFSSTKCIASFHIDHVIEIQPGDSLYFTVRCDGGSTALTATGGVITVSQL